MVSAEFTVFQNYRQKAAALRSAARDALEIFTTLGNEFNASNKYLLQRAGITQKLQDRLIRGDRQIKPLLQGLIQELDKEIKELDSMLSRISVFGAEAFDKFQRSAISHQKTQSDILNELYELGIGYFHALEDQIHARYLSVEQSHNRFREKLFEILRAIVEDKAYKSAIVDTWVDCLEFLVLYLRDDLEVGLPRHTFIELVEQETYSPARIVLQRYFTAGLGEQYLKKIEEHGLIRRVMSSGSQKVDYLSLDEDKQKKVDKIIMESLLVLLEGIQFEDSTGQRYEWDTGNEDKKKIKKLIESKFEESKPKKLTDEYKEKVYSTLDNLMKAIYAAGLSFQQFPSGSSINGFEGLKLTTSRGGEITISKIKETDKDGLLQEDKFEELNFIMRSIIFMLEGDKPHENNNSFKQFLYRNSNLFDQKIDDPGEEWSNKKDSTELWKENKVREYFFIQGSNVFDELNEIKGLIENDQITDSSLLKDSFTRSYPKFKEIIEDMIGLNTSSSGITSKEKDLFFRNLIQIKSLPKNKTDALLDELYTLYKAVFIQNYFEKSFLTNKIQIILDIASSGP